MSFDLGNLLQGQLGGILNNFMSANGESPENGSKAVGLALPAVVAGLVKNAGSGSDKLSGLFNLLGTGSGAGLDNAVETAVSGNGVSHLIESGKNLLPSIFGGKENEVADQIANESGVSKAAAGSLVALALPLVLSVLRGKVKSEGLGATQVAGLLGQQQGWLSNALSGNMLSALGIGSLGSLFGGLGSLAGNAGAAVSGAASALGTGAANAATGAAAAGAAGAGAVAAAAKSGGSGIGKWLLLAAAVIAALLGFKMCSKPSGDGAGAASAASGASVAASDVSDGMAASSASDMALPPAVPSDPASGASAPETLPSADASAATASAPAAASAADASAATFPAADTASVKYENGVAKFYFATAKSNVADGAENTVAEVINAGKEGKTLVISGFTDSTGNAKANEALSKRRAQAVQKFFEAQGVKAENIKLQKAASGTVGAQGNDAEGRRVEVKVE